jgi:hypothetical protein
VDSVEELGGLIGAEPQLLTAERGEIAHRPQASEAQRRIGLGGDDDLHIVRQPVDHVGELSCDLALGDDVNVVEHQHQRSIHIGQVVHERRQESSQIATTGLRRRRDAECENDGSAAVSAAVTQRQNRSGSSSCWSSESHATRAPGDEAAHSASRLVFPHPVGAHTSVSLASSPRESAWTSCGRGTQRGPEPRNRTLWQLESLTSRGSDWSRFLRAALRTPHTAPNFGHKSPTGFFSRQPPCLRISTS